MLYSVWEDKMVEENKTIDADEAADEIKPYEIRPDYFLQHLVDTVNRNSGKVPLPITLNVGGLMVTGFMVDGKTYYEMFAEEFKRFAGHTIQNIDEVLTGFRQWGEHYVSRYSESETEKDDTHELQYIFLKNARYLSGGKLVPSEGRNLWRGRLSSVDGFSLGVLAYSKEDEDVMETNE
jgi:hypothetical protein